MSEEHYILRRALRGAPSNTRVKLTAPFSVEAIYL